MSYELSPSGKSPLKSLAKIGDFVLTHGDNVFSRAIRFGQFTDLVLRGYSFKAAWRLAYWNHVAVVVDHDGRGHPILAEALSGGVVYTPLSEYHDKDYILIHTDTDLHDQVQIAKFAESVVRIDGRPKTVWGKFIQAVLGRGGYGYVQIAGIIFSILSRTPLRVGWGNTRICSGFASECGVRAGAIYDYPPNGMWPWHFALEYEVPIT